MKVGCSAEVVKLVKAVVEEAGLPARVCTFTYGPLDSVIMDLESESEEDLNRNRAVRHDTIGPAMAEWGKKRGELLVFDTHELLRVH